MPPYLSLLMSGICLLSLTTHTLAEPPKLSVEKLEKNPMLLTYTSDTIAGKGINPGDTFRFRHEIIQDGRKLATNSPMIRPNDNLFAQGAAMDRFTLDKVEQRQVVNPRNGIQGLLLVATIEDRQKNKLGALYEITKGSRNGLIIRDWTVTLRLGDKQIELREHETFRIPFGNKKGKLHTFKGVDKNGEVEFTTRIEGKTSQKWTLPAPLKQKK